MSVCLFVYLCILVRISAYLFALVSLFMDVCMLSIISYHHPSAHIFNSKIMSVNTFDSFVPVVNMLFSLAMYNRNRFYFLFITFLFLLFIHTRHLFFPMNNSKTSISHDLNLAPLILPITLTVRRSQI